MSEELSNNPENLEHQNDMSGEEESEIVIVNPYNFNNKLLLSNIEILALSK